MFRNIKAQRTIATLVLTTFSSLVMYPSMASANTIKAMEKAGLLPQQKTTDQGIVDNVKHYIDKMAGTSEPAARGGADERFSQLLASIHGDLKAITPQTALSKEARHYWQEAHAHQSDGAANGKATSKAKGKMDTRAIGPTVRIETEHTDIPLKPLPGTDIAAHVKALRSKAAEVRALYPQIEQSFDDTEKHLKDAKLPQEILDRQQQAKDQFEARKAEFDRLMAKVEQSKGADQQTALADLGSFMAKYPDAPPHQYTDPNKLPFRTPSGKVRAPMESKGQFQASLFPAKYEPLQVASLNLDGMQLAQATLPDTPNTADLAPSDEVQITQAIKDQAQALNNNPVQIYNWVRNNIEFIPSYGSIQGSDMTLQNKRGNAFDTASLLIALYRAAGIPARYVYGTIEVPVDQVMNWVGGVTQPAAAQSLLGQGGIPNTALTAGGTVKAFRMEHVWVQAYVDATPSHGAINQHPNTWVPMDASFKQYQFTQGMDIKDNVPVDSQALLDQIQQGATVDTTNGYVQNLNQAALQPQLTSYQTQVQSYIASQNPNATVGDVLGTQKVIAQNYSILLGSLPYKTVTVANTFQAMPDNLKWKFKTNIYPDDGYSDSSSPIIEINQSTVSLAGKKITLSFVPASQADQDLVNSYLPQPHADGTPIQPSELPQSLPGYLLHMKAEFRVDGQVVAQTTGIFTMGSNVKQASQYFNPSTGSWDGGDDNDLTVGEYDAIGIDLQGIGSAQLKTLQGRMASTQAKLQQFQKNTNDLTPIAGVTKEDITGDIVDTGILGYFAKVDSNDKLTARTLGNVQTYRLPSYGRFFISAQPHVWFGITRSVSFPGMAMDVDYLMQHSEAKDADHEKRTIFLRNVGLAGSLAENQVPEKMFFNSNLPADDPTQPQGISATKALAIASAQGQKIYTLNQSNQPSHDSILQSLQISEDVKSEIANALAVGKEVTVHEKNVSVNGWTGSGYIILDQDGAGAYKIDGGTNGGSVYWWLGAIGGASAAIVLGIAAFLATIATATAGAMIVFWVLILTIVLVNALLMMQNLALLEGDQRACYLGGILTGFGVAGLFSLPGLLAKLLALLGIYASAEAETNTLPKCEAL